MNILAANYPLFPPEDKGALQDIVPSFDAKPSFRVNLVISDESIVMPEEVVEAVVQVVTAMSDGLAVIVLPVHRTLTTHQAANLLGLRRRDVMDLLNAGEMPHHEEGRHRRVELADVLDYVEKRKAEQYEAINEMVKASYQNDQHLLWSTPEFA